MGFEEGVAEKGGSSAGGIRSLMRRKKVDSHRDKAEGHHQLAKALSVTQLIAIGVGSTIGAGVYVLVGTVAREHSGPALTISFLIAGIAAALSAFCYAELSSRCPSAGSAYHYSYICIGEGVAWLIGWALILEYTIGGSAVARGISPNLVKIIRVCGLGLAQHFLALFFGGPDSLPFPLARAHIPWLDVVVDPCAAFLVIIVTALLCVGIKESSFVQGIVTTLNVFVMMFVIVVGGYLGFKTGWIGYSLSSGYFPFGVDGMFAGAATVFFAYIGFDSVASTAEEVKDPQRDLPWGIGLALSTCCLLYMLVSIIIVGLVPYFAMDPDTPISSAFASHGMDWAVYVITAGAFLALCSTLMGSLLPQPRILMAMARDGLLPSFFSDVNKKTQVPVKATIATGTCAALLSFFMDVSQLAGMVSVGTLLAFTIVAVSILVLRFVPPDEVPLSSAFHESVSAHHFSSGSADAGEMGKEIEGTSSSSDLEGSPEFPLIVKATVQDRASEEERRKKAAASIAAVCVGAVILTLAASSGFLPSFVKYGVSAAGGILLLVGLAVLSWIDQDDARHSFGHSGGFTCPFVPLLPICSILINVYLLVNLGGGTWFRVSIWLVIGVFVYLFYGRTHSSLTDAVYVSTSHAEEIYSRSSGNIA